MYEFNSLTLDDTTQEITTSHWIIFFIALSEFIGCIAIIIYIPKDTTEESENPEDINNDPRCKAQGCLLTFCEITTICFSSILSYWILQMSKENMSIDDVQNGKKMWVLYGYLPGLLFSIIPLFLTNSQSGQKNIYGLSGYWCWLGFKEGMPFTEMKAQTIFTLIFYI